MLEINRKLAPGEVRKLLVSVVKREFNSRHYNILFCFFFCFEAVSRGLHNVSNNRFNFKDF